MKNMLVRGIRTDNGEQIEGFYAYHKDVLKNKETHRIYLPFAESDCGEFYPDWFEIDPETVELVEKKDAVLNEIKVDITDIVLRTIRSVSPGISVNDAKQFATVLEQVLRTQLASTRTVSRTPIETLNISMRTYNILKRAEINYVEELCSWDETALSRLRGVGKHVMEELLAIRNENS